jgi:hypothetical protein
MREPYEYSYAKNAGLAIKDSGNLLCRVVTTPQTIPLKEILV